MSTPSGTPHLWAFVGHRPGDNAQVRTLSAAVGFPVEEKELRFTRKRWLPNWLSGRTRASLDVSASSRLEPPWPDAIIAVGYRSVPIARWVQAQSGGRTRLIHIGRPRSPLRWFDLVITTPQYDLPIRDNVVHNHLPIVATRSTRLENEAMWRSRLRTDDGPVIGVLVGGDAMPYRFDPASAEALACGARALARRLEGHLAVTCGHRVRADAADKLEAALDERVALFHRFHDTTTDNPYPALIQLADAFIVTTDSVSMMAEAVGTGRPVHLVEPTRRNSGRKGLILTLGAAFERCLPRRLRDALVAAGIMVPVRKTERISSALLDAGHAVRLGDTRTLTPTAPRPSVAPDLIARIRRIITEPPLGDRS